MAKVSIIIPVYNVEVYLRECLESVVNQTLQDIEIICVNDGSTDGSLKILEEYASNDDRIKIINQENQGQGIARNNAINAASGEFIGFVDPDDWVDLTMYEKMYNSAIENDCELVECLYNKYYDVNKITRAVISKDIKPLYNSVISLKEMPEYLLMGHCAVVWNKLFKREMLLNNKIKFENVKLGEDNIVSFSSRMFSKKIYLLAEHLYFYRQRKNSTMYKKSREYFSLIDVNKNIISAIKKQGFYEPNEANIKNHVIRVLAVNYNRIEQSDVQEYDDAVKAFLSPCEFKKYTKLKRDNRSLSELIFSIKNKEISGVLYKVITILGLKIKLQK